MSSTELTTNYKDSFEIGYQLPSNDVYSDHTCPSCGAPITGNKCEYCGRVFAPGLDDLYDKEIISAEEYIKRIPDKCKACKDSDDDLRQINFALWDLQVAQTRSHRAITSLIIALIVATLLGLSAMMRLWTQQDFASDIAYEQEIQEEQNDE